MLPIFLLSFAPLPDLFSNNADAPTTFIANTSQVDGTLPISPAKRASRLDDDILAGKREGARHLAVCMSLSKHLYCNAFP